MSPLPGYIDGVSAGIIAGYNLGIDGSISSEKLKIAVEAVKYLSSKEIQRKYFLVDNLFSGITSLYDDPEICENIDCETCKKIQFINRPSSSFFQFSNYIKRIEENVYQYLFGNETVERALEKVEDLTRIHYVSIKDKDSNNALGLCLFIFVVLFSIIILVSIFLIFNQKLTRYFDYMNTDSWIISLFGLIVLISNCYTTLGPVTDAKCHFYIILLVLGYTLNLVPILYQLIIDFPEHNKFSKWIMQNKYYFTATFILTVLVILSLFANKLFEINVILLDDGKNFATCKIRNIFSVFILAIPLLYFLFIIFSMLVLCYVEWGLKDIIYDIHIIVIAIYFDVFSVILLFIFNFIQINNYIMQFLIKNIFTLMPVITSYITIYAFRLYLPFYKEKDDRVSGLKSDDLHISSTRSTTSEGSNGRHLILKLKDYHDKSMNVQKSSKSLNNFTNTGYSIDATSKYNGGAFSYISNMSTNQGI